MFSFIQTSEFRFAKYLYFKLMHILWSFEKNFSRNAPGAHVISFHITSTFVTEDLVAYT